MIAASDLERELRKIPGTVVVIADCCGSGGLIGQASSLEDFNRGIVQVFSGRIGSPSFAGSKYKVVASASLDQDSYRISFDENVTESDMATVLARALCDGAGWSLGSARRAAYALMWTTTVRSRSTKSAFISPAASPGISMSLVNWPVPARLTCKTCRYIHWAIPLCCLGGRGNRRVLPPLYHTEWFFSCKFMLNF